MNLVDNAIKFSPTGSGIVIRVSHSRDRAVIDVIDHGPGVPESLVPTLFSRLRTLGRSDRDRARGTGLGLALVKGLVEAMGGRVAYEPSPDGGALFSLALPRPRARTTSA